MTTPTNKTNPDVPGFPPKTGTMAAIEAACEAGLNSDDPKHWEAGLRDIMQLARASLAQGDGDAA
jgi:hypothetical protein